MTERNDPQDQELAALYRASAQEQPSAGLDARILAAARGAASVPRPAATSWVSRWRIPVALAATVVLTTTLTLMVQDEESGRLSAPDSGAGAKQAPQPAAAPARQSAPVVTPAAPKSSPKPSLAQPEEMTAPLRDSAAPPLVSGQAAKSSEEPASPRPEAVAPDLSRSAGRISGERKAMRAAPARDDLPSGNLTKDQPALEEVRPEMQAAPPAPAPAAKRADSAERAGATAPTERSPEQWLAEIRKLRQESKTAEAEASLAEFRKRYPQFPLPDDLKQP